jgi:hypothetical protein
MSSACPVGRTAPTGTAGPAASRKPRCTWLPDRLNGSGPMRPSVGLSTTSAGVSFHSTIRSGSGSRGSRSPGPRRVRTTRFTSGSPVRALVTSEIIDTTSSHTRS